MKKTFLDIVDEKEENYSSWYPKTVGLGYPDIHPSTMIPDSYRNNPEEFIKVFRESISCNTPRKNKV
jgi:hypothetical protein